MKQKDSSLHPKNHIKKACRSEQASLGPTILKKLDTLEELIKKKADKPLTFKEACAYLGYAPSYLYKLTYKNIIPHYKPTGKMVFFSKTEIDEWIFKGSDERRVDSDELKTDKNTEKDPNQVEMFEKPGDERSETGEKEIIIEFPLNSRRGK